MFIFLMNLSNQEFKIWLFQSKIHDILYGARNNETVVKKISMLTGGWCGLLTIGRWKYVQYVTGDLEGRGGGS